MQEKLDSLITELLATTVGGEPYFSALDARLQQRDNLEIVLALFENIITTGTIVVTGGFGHYIRELRAHRLLNGGRKIIHVSGDLRHGNRPRFLFHDVGVSSYNITLVDDSYYSGTTERAVKTFLGNNGYEVNRVMVVYDGSRERHSHVTSLYRYYDRHPQTLARKLLLH